LLGKILEPITGPMNKTELRELLELASDDIKINRYMWDKRTSITDLIQIIKVCNCVLGAIKRAAS
jgi:hypothetical protein